MNVAQTSECLLYVVGTGFTSNIDRTQGGIDLPGCETLRLRAVFLSSTTLELVEEVLVCLTCFSNLHDILLLRVFHMYVIC